MIRTYSLKDFLLFTEAWLLLALSRLLLVFVPFKKIVPLMGKMIDRDSKPNETAVNEIVLQKITVAILRGCRYSPWRTMCFEQALAGKMMLKVRNKVATIFFGVYKSTDDKNNLFAHAWLVCNGFTVTGGRNLSHYTVLSAFES